MTIFLGKIRLITLKARWFKMLCFSLILQSTYTCHDHKLIDCFFKSISANLNTFKRVLFLTQWSIYEGVYTNMYGCINYKSGFCSCILKYNILFWNEYWFLISVINCFLEVYITYCICVLTIGQKHQVLLTKF